MSGFDPKHLTNKDNWIRFGFTLLFFIIVVYVYYVIGAIFLVSFATLLLTGSPNEQVRDFGRSFSSFIYQVCLFVTFNSDVKPFPFDSWPKE